MKPVNVGASSESGRDDHELHGELAAARLHRRQLDAPLHDGALAGGEVPREAGTMRVAQTGRYDQLGERATNGLEARVAEGLLGRGVEVGDAPAGVHGDDAVERRVHNRGASVARANERLERALALELLGQVLKAQRHLSGAAVGVRQGEQRQPGPDAGRRVRRVPARCDVNRPSACSAADELVEVALAGADVPEEVPEPPIREHATAVSRADLEGYRRILEDPLEKTGGVGTRTDGRQQ